MNAGAQLRLALKQTQGLRVRFRQCPTARPERQSTPNPNPSWQRLWRLPDLCSGRCPLSFSWTSMLCKPWSGQVSALQEARRVPRTSTQTLSGSAPKTSAGKWKVEITCTCRERVPISGTSKLSQYLSQQASRTSMSWSSTWSSGSFFERWGI